MQKYTHTHTQTHAHTQSHAHKRSKEPLSHCYQSHGLRIAHLFSPQATTGREKVGKPQALPTSAVKSVLHVKIKSWSARIADAFA